MSNRLYSTDVYSVDVIGKTMWIILNHRGDPDIVTDASEHQRPDPTERVQNADGRISFYENMDNSDQDRLWRNKLGKWLYLDVIKGELAQRNIRRCSLSLYMFHNADASVCSYRRSEMRLIQARCLPSPLHFVAEVDGHRARTAP